jgi:hypothetical protein
MYHFGGVARNSAIVGLEIQYRVNEDGTLFAFV